MKTTAQITAIGSYLPPDVLTNADLEQMVETSDAWILERTGIRERRILGKGRGSSYMGAQAVQQLLERRGIAPTEIDLLICATVTPDMQFPATANLISHSVGATRAWSFDLEAACSSFLFALATGAQFIETGRCKKVVVVGSDKMSSIIDYTDRNTCILFGDGAGAVLLEPDTRGLGVLDFVHYTDGAGAAYLHQKAGGSVKPASVDTVLAREHFVYQDGKPVFKAAVVGMADAAAEIMTRNHLTSDAIRFLVPHQANKRIIDATAQRAGLPPERVMLNIDRYGNTTSATLPLCLADYAHALHPGDNLLLATFGGGFTWGAMWLKWGHLAHEA